MKVIQIPWFERKFNFDFPAGLFPVIYERLAGTYPRLNAFLHKIPEARLIHKPGGSWSVKEETGHLYDLESLWAGRIDDFIAGLPEMRKADLTNRKTHEAGHNEQPIGKILEQFLAARIELLQKIEDRTEEELVQKSMHPRLEKPMRMIDLLFFVAEHDDHHLARIRELLT